MVIGAKLQKVARCKFCSTRVESQASLPSGDGQAAQARVQLGCRKRKTSVRIQTRIVSSPQTLTFWMAIVVKIGPAAAAALAAAGRSSLAGQKTHKWEFVKRL